MLQNIFKSIHSFFITHISMRFLKILYENEFQFFLFQDKGIFSDNLHNKLLEVALYIIMSFMSKNSFIINLSYFHHIREPYCTSEAHQWNIKWKWCQWADLPHIEFRVKAFDLLSLIMLFVGFFGAYDQVEKATFWFILCDNKELFNTVSAGNEMMI